MLYSSIPTSSMVFVRKSVTRLPPVPYRANVTMLQDSLYVTDCYFSPVSHRHSALQHNTVTQKHRRFAARLTGDYLDQTFTDKLITACKTHNFHPLERVPPGTPKNESDIIKIIPDSFRIMHFLLTAIPLNQKIS